MQCFQRRLISIVRLESGDAGGREDRGGGCVVTKLSCAQLVSRGNQREELVLLCDALRNGFKSCLAALAFACSNSSVLINHTDSKSVFCKLQGKCHVKDGAGC